MHGLKLKSYEFNKYKSKKETRLITVNVFGNKNKPSVQDQLKFRSLEEGTFFARDLVSEPGNIYLEKNTSTDDFQITYAKKRCF